MQPPLPTPPARPWAPQRECRDPAGRTSRGAGRAIALGSSEAAAASPSPGSCSHRPRAQPRMEPSEGPPPPSRNGRRVSGPAQNEAGIRDRAVWGHRWDAEQSSGSRKIPPRPLPLASQILGREVFPVHRLRELSITTEPCGKCGSQARRQRLGESGSRVASGDKYIKPCPRATWLLGPPLRS